MGKKLDVLRLFLFLIKRVLRIAWKRENEEWKSNTTYSAFVLLVSFTAAVLLIVKDLPFFIVLAVAIGVIYILRVIAALVILILMIVGGREEEEAPDVFDVL